MSWPCWSACHRPALLEASGKMVAAYVIPYALLIRLKTMRLAGRPSSPPRWRRAPL